MVQTRGSRRRIARVNVEEEHYTGVVTTRGGRRKAKDAAFNPPTEVDDNQKSPDLRRGGERRQNAQKPSTIPVAEDAQKAATIANVMPSCQRILTCVVVLVIAGGVLNFAGMFLKRLEPPPPPPPPAHVITKFLSQSYWALACCVVVAVAAVWRASTTRNNSLRSKLNVKGEVEKEKDREEELRESRATEEAHQKLDWVEERVRRECQTAEEELNPALSRVPSTEPLLEKEAFMFDEVSGLTVPSSSLPVLSRLQNQNLTTPPESPVAKRNTYSWVHLVDHQKHE